MINKIKAISKYAANPRKIIKGIKNPKRIFIFFNKDLIFKPEDFIFKTTEKNRPAIKKYLKEIKTKREFNNYIWYRYNNFEKALRKKSKDATAGGISREMGIILYVIIRLIKPENVLETGVASGVSSAYILAALEDNQKGKLISCDLPNKIDGGCLSDCRKEEEISFIPKHKTAGWLIPETLKNRWQYVFGKSSEKLPEILKDISSIDFFLHDSEHSYQNMFWEYETVWSFLTKGGLLLSHDINSNKAFDDFCAKINRKGIKYREEFGGIKK